MWQVATVLQNATEVSGRCNYTWLEESENFTEEVTPGVHLKGWVEIHWAELKGDHPERKNSKKKSKKVEGNIWEPRVLGFLCIMAVLGNRALYVKLNSLTISRQWAASSGFEKDSNTKMNMKAMCKTSYNKKNRGI